jgi:hypothetical protein
LLIGIDFLGFDNGAIFDTRGSHDNYYSLEIRDGLFDHLHVDRDLATDETTNKTSYFTYLTLLNAPFKGDLEAGSISLMGTEIERIRFQKRRTDELYWTDVAEYHYDFPNKRLYEALDKYVQNDFDYEYSLLPVTNEVLGHRVVSDPIKVKYEGYFLSDMNHNYQLLLNADFGTIEHTGSNSVMETLNGRYPIVSYSNLDYRQGSLQAILLTPQSIDTGKIYIKEENIAREKVINFLKNKRPKILRTVNGEIMLIGVVGNPSEIPNNKVAGVSSISFDYVEINEINSETLKNNGLILGLSEV